MITTNLFWIVLAAIIIISAGLIYYYNTRDEEPNSGTLIQEAQARVFKKYTPAQDIAARDYVLGSEVTLPETIPESYELIFIIPQAASKKLYVKSQELYNKIQDANVNIGYVWDASHHKKIKPIYVEVGKKKFFIHDTFH